MISAVSLCNVQALPSEAIRALPTDFLVKRRRSCVYFLCIGEDILYVGETENFRARMKSHVSDKSFDSVYIVWCSSREERKRLEKRFIAEFKPPLNGKLGRPQKPEHEKRINPVRQVGRWDDASWEFIQRAAAHGGENVTEFAKRVMMREAKSILGEK